MVKGPDGWVITLDAWRRWGKRPTMRMAGPRGAGTICSERPPHTLIYTGHDWPSQGSSSPTIAGCSRVRRWRRWARGATDRQLLFPDGPR